MNRKQAVSTKMSQTAVKSISHCKELLPTNLATVSILDASKQLRDHGFLITLAEMALLPPDLPEPTTLEKQFAEGHLHEGRRLGFLARRRIARAILGALTNMDPSVVEITAGGKGEPVISHPKGLFHLSFSAREDIALIGIATRPIGVDIEIARQDMLIPRNMLREDERVLLDALPEEARPSAFCALWTAKEAIVKAMHCGFRLPPEAIHVEGWNAGPTLTLVDIGTGPGGTGLSPAVWHLKTWPNLVVAGLTGGLVVGAACIA